MKITKIFAGILASATVLTSAVTAFAGNGGPINTINDNWINPGTTLVKRMIYGAESDHPVISFDDVANLEKVTTVKVTIGGDFFFKDDTWGSSGSIVLCSNAASWDQKDWKIGTAKTLEDGSIDPEANKDLEISEDKDAKTATISFTNADGLWAGNDFEQKNGYYCVAMQSFDDNGEGYTVEDFELLDKDGNVLFSEGTSGDKNALVSGTDESSSETESSSEVESSSESKADASSSSSSKADSSSSTSSSSSKADASSAGTSNNSTATTTSTNADTGATAGLAFAGVALAGVAMAVTRKKK